MAATKDITVDQGATHTEAFTIETLTDPALPYDALTNPYIALDISAAIIRMQVRSSYDSNTVLLTATEVNGKFTKTTTGAFTLTLSATDTSAIRFAGDQASYVYDIELDFTTSVIRVCQGAFIINREVTR